MTVHFESRRERHNAAATGHKRIQTRRVRRESARSLVPVSVRTGTALDNEVSLLLPLLPVEPADPVQRLVRVHRRLGTLKAAKKADAGAVLTATAAHEPFAPVAWAIRAAAHLPQRNVVTVTTTVRGPAEPLSALGRRILRIHPYVPIALRVRVGVAMLSYAGEVTFGITSDADAVPETDVPAKAIRREVGSLREAARRTSGLKRHARDSRDEADTGLDRLHV